MLGRGGGESLVEPFVTDAGARAEVEAMIALLDAHGEASWR